MWLEEWTGGGVTTRGVEEWVLKRLSALSIERFTWRCFLDELSVVEEEGTIVRIFSAIPEVLILLFDPSTDGFGTGVVATLSGKASGVTPCLSARSGWAPC
jgi:hypothetical protein